MVPVIVAAAVLLGPASPAGAHATRHHRGAGAQRGAGAGDAGPFPLPGTYEISFTVRVGDIDRASVRTTVAVPAAGRG